MAKEESRVVTNVALKKIGLCCTVFGSQKQIVLPRGLGRDLQRVPRRQGGAAGPLLRRRLPGTRRVGSRRDRAQGKLLCVLLGVLNCHQEPCRRCQPIRDGSGSYRHRGETNLAVSSFKTPETNHAPTLLHSRSSCTRTKRACSTVSRRATSSTTTLRSIEVLYSKALTCRREMACWLLYTEKRKRLLSKAPVPSVGVFRANNNENMAANG